MGSDMHAHASQLYNYIHIINACTFRIVVFVHVGLYMWSSPFPTAPGPVSEDSVSFCERTLELLTDLEAQLPTRRFFNTLLDNTHFIVSCGDNL